jgi:DNA-binding beta-propeller fold protein YncE
MHLRRSWTALATAGCLCAVAADFRVPGLKYAPQIRDDVSILPGGRALQPFGRLVLTGTAPFAVGVSPSGKTIVTANIGISTAIGVNRPSITVIAPGKKDAAWNLADFSAEPRQSRSQAWQGLTAGLAVTSDGAAWVSEGDSGRVVELNLSNGGRKAAVNLNAENYSNSFSQALVHDTARNLLIVLDQANSRAAVIDLKRPAVLASVKTGVMPVSVALSTEAKRLYVASTGNGHPSLSIIDLANPAAPQLTGEVPLTGVPSAIAAHGDEVYVSLSHEDAIAVVNGQTAKPAGEILLRIPGLESYRGITPLGVAFDPKSGRLLVAEAGINAVGVIDPVSRKLLGHLPAGWFPNSLGVYNGQVYVASARGLGTGPSSPAHRIRMFGGGKALSFETDTAVLRRGSLTSFAVPNATELAHQSEVVMQTNGFLPASSPAPAQAAPPVRYVVLIIKGNRAFDEILGDVTRAGDKAVIAESTYARFGLNGYVSGGKNRFSLHVDVTPNHHALAERWSFADNFYTDSDYSSLGASWLTGYCPDGRSEASALHQEAGNQQSAVKSDDSPPLFSYLSRHDIDTRKFAYDVEAHTSDQQRASRFIAAISQDYVEPRKPLPRFLLLNLPNDAGGPVRPEEGFAYEAAYVADNDYALGRVVGFLSGTPWWNEMAIFVTESGAEGGADHVDSHRTLLLGVGPWFRSNYVSHTNSSAPALLRTIFRLFDLPPMSLYDATAGNLLDMFGKVPDFSPYEVQPEDSRLFDPLQVKP